MGPPVRFLRRSSRSILIPPCRDQNPRLAPRLVEDADDLLQLVLRDPRVHRRRLNVRVAQVLLHHAQIAAGAPMQLYSTGMTECMRVKLWETRPPAEGLDDLPTWRHGPNWRRGCGPGGAHGCRVATSRARSVDSIHVRKPLRPLSHGGG